MKMIEKNVVFWVNIMTVFIFEFAQKLAKKTVSFYEFANFDICVARPNIRLFAVCRIRVNYGNAD